ncbi:MAG: dipeptide epimerase [bacterium]
MKITDIQLSNLSIPLKTPFKTALRTVSKVEDILVKIYTDTGHIGIGSAAPTALITGETIGSIKAAIEDHIKKKIIGLSMDNFEELMINLQKSILKNTSAKAAIDMALYDLYGKLYKAPVYKLMGGYRREIITDITISLNKPEEMLSDSLNAIEEGFKTLKIKIGKDFKKDISLLKRIREKVGDEIHIRLDANQGWSPKEAVYILNSMQDAGIRIELIEQPVSGKDLEGLKFVTDNVSVPVLADESAFSPLDVFKIIQMRAADLINIKLMKTGGIYNALKICAMAESVQMECMMGCMLESKVSVTAAAHLACAKSIITKIDLDPPILCMEDPIDGGALYKGNKIILSDEPGFGIKGIKQ